MKKIKPKVKGMTVSNLMGKLEREIYYPEEKIKAWIEFYNQSPTPSIHWTKPTQREMKMAKEFGCSFYECEITVNKLIK
jgi:predicted peroxiredoxin